MPMPIWEYAIKRTSTNFSEDDRTEPELNAWGLEGWEIIFMAPPRLVLCKRPILPPDQEA